MTSVESKKKTSIFMIKVIGFLKLTKALATSMVICILFFHGSRCLFGAAKSNDFQYAIQKTLRHKNNKNET